MKILNNAIVFKAELPRIDLLAQHLEELAFVPVSEIFVSGSGFIPNKVTGELVTPIDGGFTFTMRHDEKILPKASVLAAVGEAIALEVETLGRDLDKEETAAVTERKMAELIAKAMIKTTIVNAFYSIDQRYLVVPTTNKKLAQVLVSNVIKAVGSVKTETIHVSDVKGGLTARLKKHIAGEEKAFDGFTIGSSCLLKEKSNRVSFDLGDLDCAKQGLHEALEDELQVERMELVHGTMSFKLTKDFHLRGICYFGELTEDEEAERDGIDTAMLWRMEAAIQLLQLSAAITALCELLGYKEGDGIPVEAPADKGNAKELDQLEEIEAADLAAATEHVRSTGLASVSAIQRKFLWGYNRAFRMIEALEKAGVVTPISSNGSREVIR